MNDSSTWFEANARAVEARLAPVVAAPDGVLYQNRDSENDLLVLKHEGMLYFYFHAELDAEIQSRMEVARPLHLVSPYTQMVMLSLLWNEAPKRVYVIGLGGGRLPMVMHHWLPDTQVDCAEIDAEVVAVAKQFFAIEEDARLRIIVKDGRGTLQAHAATEPYDIIVVDAFVGLGSGPRAFATTEFFALCRERLAPSGVVVINLLDNDPAREIKRQTVVHSFPLVLAIRDDERGNSVLFGCNDASMTPALLMERAKAYMASHALGFSLEELAAQVRVLPKPSVLSLFQPLRDRDQPKVNAVKVGRNDPCVCGSGKKYKKCCGA